MVHRHTSAASKNTTGVISTSGRRSVASRSAAGWRSEIMQQERREKELYRQKETYKQYLLRWLDYLTMVWGTGKEVRITIDISLPTEEEGVS